MSTEEHLQNKISKFFQTGEWDILRKLLIENGKIAEHIFKVHIDDYQPNDFINKQLIKGYINQKIKFFYYKEYLTIFLYHLMPNVYSG